MRNDQPRQGAPGHAGQAPHGAGETPRHGIGARGEGDADLRSARQTVIGQLSERGIDVLEDDDDAGLADLLTAVQRFESTVRDLGGDSYTNSTDSSQPDEPAFVLPRRGDDESLAAFTARVQQATHRAAAQEPRSGDATATGPATEVRDRGEGPDAGSGKSDRR